MPERDSRAGQLNAVIDPKLLFLAKLAARYKGQSLVEFVEDAFRHALSPESIAKDENEYGQRTRVVRQPLPLFQEGLWDEDERVRLFLTAITDRSWLTPKQRAKFDSITGNLIKQGKKVSLKTFLAAFGVVKDGE